MTSFAIDRIECALGAYRSDAHAAVYELPPWLSWQSARLLTDRSLVRAQVEALLLESTVRVDSSVARIPAFQAGGPGSIPGRRTFYRSRRFSSVGRASD